MCGFLMSAQHFAGKSDLDVKKNYHCQIQLIKKQMEVDNIKAIVFELSQKSDLLKSIFFDNK